MSAPRPHSPALPHGEIAEIFPGIHFVTGCVTISAPLPARFSRNMTIIDEDGALILVNSVRLGEAGLATLDALGEVRHVIRLAGFHGMDDPFYKQTYGARVWSVDAPYAPGFGNGAPYFTPDETLAADTALPVHGARLIPIDSSRPAEALLHLDRDGGILVSGDCLQNIARPDGFYNLAARVMMRMMGFLKPHNVGPGWLKAAKPDPDEIRARLGSDFAHVLPAHGTPVLGDAARKYAPALAALR